MFVDEYEAEFPGNYPHFLDFLKADWITKNKGHPIKI